MPTTILTTRMLFAASNNSRRAAVFLALILFSGGCGSTGVKDSVAPVKTEMVTVRVCDAERYRDNSDFQESSEKTDVHKIKNDETVYLQDETKKCETVFDEDYGLECGVQRSLRLVWRSSSQIIDSFSFLDSGCENPGSHSLVAEPWAPDSIEIKDDLIKVRHSWNYYVRTKAEEKNQCLLRNLKIDRKKMKLTDLGWGKCQSVRR